MKSMVRPELPTASVGSSQAPPAAVDNSAPSVSRPESTYKSGKVVQTNGATSVSSDFTYCSDNNTDWMSIPSLQAWIEQNRDHIGKI